MNPFRSGEVVLHYKIHEKIGEGGMGEVYRAEDLRLGRQVAIKLLGESVTGIDPYAAERLLREAQTASQLNHPNIVTIYTIEHVAESDLIVMEYIEGKTLSTILKTGAMDIRLVLDIGIQLSDALAAAHAAGVIHRDIKPANILITSKNQAKILDFGLAKLNRPIQEVGVQPEKELTQTGIIIGTIAYMSPEQTRGEILDPQTDIFSLGSVLYQAATGKAPFEGDSVLETMHKIATATAVHPSKLNSTIPEEFDEIIAQTLTKGSSERCSAAKLSMALQQLKMLQQDSNPMISSASIGIRPQTRYTRSGDVNIAYQVLGDGPRDLVFVMGWVSHLEYFWEEPSFARFLKRLGSFSRLILFDKRGTGLSDRLTQLPTLEQRMDDVRAVMDAVGSEKAVLCGISEGGPMCSLFAATYPERTIALVMIGTYAKRIWEPDYPWAPTVEQREKFFQEIAEKWGGPVGIQERAPSAANDPRFREWWATYLRMGASPGAAVALTRMNAEIDVRNILPSIYVPTLILHRAGDRCIKVEEARYLSQRIPGARYVELAGHDHLPFVGDQEEILQEIETFLDELQEQQEPERVLATLLYASFEPDHDASKGDLKTYHDSIRRELSRFRAKEISSTNHNFLAAFDGPARAIRSACMMATTAARKSLRIRIGLHTGECDAIGDQLQGIAVSIAEEIASKANHGEVLVSATVKDLVAGSGIRFEDRGIHNLISEDRRLFAATA